MLMCFYFLMDSPGMCWKFCILFMIVFGGMFTTPPPPKKKQKQKQKQKTKNNWTELQVLLYVFFVDF